MPAGRYDLVIQQGAPFNRTFTFTNGEVARTGLTLAEAHIKATAQSTTTLLDMDAYLTVDANAATATLEVPQAIVDALTFTKPAHWDLFCTLEGAREKMCFGTVILVPNVTD